MFSNYKRVDATVIHKNILINLVKSLASQFLTFSNLHLEKIKVFF